VPTIVPVASNVSQWEFGVQTKLGYAKYLKDLKMKIGDYVVNKTRLQNTTKYDILQVDSIIEIHWHVTWMQGKPLCLYLKTEAGTKFTACPDDYIVIDRNDYP